MEALTCAQIRLPDAMSEAERDALVRAETLAAERLRANGSLVRIWRVPGAWANVTLWNVESPTELHSVLTSLPLFHYMTIEVTALAAHPLEAERFMSSSPDLQRS